MRSEEVSATRAAAARGASKPARHGGRSAGAERCRRKFLRFFPGGFRDETYLAWEREYGFDLRYKSRPSWETYAGLLDFAEAVRRDQRDLGPRDMIDLQSFMWVQGSDEYEE